MFNRFKKFITLILCAAVLNACVLPSTALFGVKKPITKPQNAKANSVKTTTDMQSDEENPTLQDTWQKLKNFEWDSLTKADAWNIGKVAGGTALSIAVTYALFKSKPTADAEPVINPTQPKPGDNPNAIPLALQDIMSNDLYEPEYKEKITALCNNNYRKQLQTKKLDDPKNQLIKEIGQTNNPTPKNIKHLIDQNYNVLQKHLESGKIIKKESTDTPSTNNTEESTTTSTTTKEENAPQSLYHFAEQAQKNNALVDVTVPRQQGLRCALHALYDGNYINGQLSDNNITAENLNNIPLLAEQISRERANADFTIDCNNWTSQTARRRKADASEKYIRHQLHSCVRLTQEEQSAQSGFFNYIFSIISGSPLHTLTPKERNSRDLIANISKEIIIHHQNAQDILLWNDSENINPEAVYQNILNLAHQCNRNLTQQQLDDMHAFITLLDTQKLKANFNGTLAIDETKAKNHAYYNHPHLSTDFTGENLDSHELEILIEQMGKNIEFAYDNQGELILNAFDIHRPETHVYGLNEKISIINDTANIIPDNRDGTIITVIQHQMNQCNKFVHTFMIRLGAVKIGNASSTHWISVTLMRCNNKNHYFITDSMNTQYVNGSDLQLNIKQLINALEQPYIAQIKHVEEVTNNENTTASSSTTRNDAPTNSDNTAPDNTTLSAINQELLDAFNNLVIDKDINTQSTSQDQNPTDSSTQTETNAAPHAPSAHPITLASIPTIAQFGSSCAYHALNNANTILQLINEVIPAEYTFEDTATYISNSLCTDASQANIILKFDEQNASGEWRDIIRTKRLNAALKTCINEKLLQSIPRTQEQITQYNNLMATYKTDKANWDARKEKRGYRHKDPMPQEPTLSLSPLVDSTVRARLNDIATACATQLIRTNDTINLANNNLQDTLINTVRATNPALLENGREEDIRDCIALLNADELAKNFGEEITGETAMHDNPQQKREVFGDDLDADELQLLLTNGSVENYQNISIIARIKAPSYAIENSYALSGVIDVIKAKIESSDTCSHAFLIRSGFSKEINNLEDEMNQSNYGTHWISVVLYRINGHNHYIIADSLKDTKHTLNKNNRTTDPDVTYLIAMLES